MTTIIAITALAISLFHVYVLIQLCQRVVDIERKLTNARVSISSGGCPTTRTYHTHSARVDFN